VSSPVTVTVNALPTVALTNPASGSYFFISPTNIPLGATAADSDGNHYQCLRSIRERTCSAKSSTSPTPSPGAT